METNYCVKFVFNLKPTVIMKDTEPTKNQHLYAAENVWHYGDTDDKDEYDLEKAALT